MLNYVADVVRLQSQTCRKSQRDRGKGESQEARRQEHDNSVLNQNSLQKEVAIYRPALACNPVSHHLHSTVS